jgi:hypothetical protein
MKSQDIDELQVDPPSKATIVRWRLFPIGFVRHKTYILFVLALSLKEHFLFLISLRFKHSNTTVTVFIIYSLNQNQNRCRLVVWLVQPPLNAG